MSLRSDKFNRLQESWDLIIIGGGITGAAIYNLAQSLQIKTLLVDARDFSWGTSSRSSKLIHGGLRYLKQGKFKLTRDAINERERILSSLKQYAEPTQFYYPIYRGGKPSRSVLKLGLLIYDTLAGKYSHKFFDKVVSKSLFPDIRTTDFEGFFSFQDGVTDDANLVLGLLNGGESAGSQKINYAKVLGLIKKDNQVCGITLQDEEDVPTPAYEVFGKAVINATGIWSDTLRGQLNKSKILRPLKGSHIIIPSWRLNLTQTLSMPHPVDNRPVYIIPWKNVLMVGTSDIDTNSKYQEASISSNEVSYFLDLLNFYFPLLDFRVDDIIATFSGVRPVLDSGKPSSPSSESRDEVLKVENGLVTVTGGKLTTHRLTAISALRAIADRVPQARALKQSLPIKMDASSRYGYGNYRDDLKDNQDGKKMTGFSAPSAKEIHYPFQSQFIHDTSMTWAKLQDLAKDPTIVHLDDLLLRRTRLGLLLKGGGENFLPQIKAVCKQELNWTEESWQTEIARYREIWQSHYSLPEKP